MSVASICARRPATTAAGSSHDFGRRSCGLPTTQRTRRGAGRATSSTFKPDTRTVIGCHFAMNSTRTQSLVLGTGSVWSNVRTMRPSAAGASVYAMNSRWKNRFPGARPYFGSNHVTNIMQSL